MINRRNFIALASGLLVPYVPERIYSFSSFDKELTILVDKNGSFRDCIGVNTIKNRVKYAVEQDDRSAIPDSFRPYFKLLSPAEMVRRLPILFDEVSEPKNRIRVFSGAELVAGADPNPYDALRV